MPDEAKSPPAATPSHAPPAGDRAAWDEAVRTGRARVVELPPAPDGRLPRWAASCWRFLTLTARAARLRWRRRAGDDRC